jgi:outer membrane protein TolC
MLPAARDQLAAVRAGFESGRADFADVIEAERAVRSAELGIEQGRAEESRRAAELVVALGRMPAGGAAAHDGHGGSHE